MISEKRKRFVILSFCALGHGEHSFFLGIVYARVITRRLRKESGIG